MAFNRAFQDAIGYHDREISTYEEELIDKTAQMASRLGRKRIWRLLCIEKKSQHAEQCRFDAKKNMKEQTNEIAITKLENDGLKCRVWKSFR